ncbi:hypothetical protein CM240_2233 [Clostridium bornimense]|uniref:Glutamate-rich protein GrpB n=1 Tax=Clostridium bornimense TaxID=1216932 RepID=W6RXI5_9CLOT|nr:GrpB family protein [Clostridium bornimense]CDM69376.1 hypothetical protein CM240_2233 [Clostridium bornimense]
MAKELSEMSLEELWQLFPIILKEHNPEYSSWYLEEKESLINIVGKNNIARINHIGSTSVKGLIAKPTVDILLEINNDCGVQDLKERLLNNGWLLMSYSDDSELRIVFNKGYTEYGFAEKVFHLHLRYFNDWNELYFRDYLQLNKEVADEYGKLKLSLKDKYEHNRDGYTEAKTEFIMKYTEIAREKFGEKYKGEKR